MHIPDGFVSGAVNAATYAASGAVCAVALARAERTLDENRIPLLGITAAFIFAAQMLNFPIAGGTSGHFLGAMLAAILLGPLNGCIVMALVLSVQALVFGDGGLTSLGSNVFNMAVVGGLACYGFFRLLSIAFGASRRGFLAAAALSSWLSVVAVAGACALELSISGTSPLRVALPAMVGAHALVGVGEAVITVTVLSMALASRPDLIRHQLIGMKKTPLRDTPRPSENWFALAALVACAALAAVVSPLASRRPDALERFIQSTDAAIVNETDGGASSSAMGGYRIGAIGSNGFSTAMAGLVGALGTFALAMGAARLLSAKRSARKTAPDPRETNAPLRKSYFERYTDLGSPIHRLDTRAKIGSFFLLIVVCVSTPPTAHLIFLGIFALLMSLLVVSRVPFGYVFKRSLMIIPFVGLVAVFIPFLPTDKPGGGYSLGVGSLTVSRTGLIVFWNLLIKAYLAVFAMTLLSSTTSFARLLQALAQLRAPKVMIMLASFTYRYLFVLVDEALRLNRARRSRSHRGNWFWHARVIGHMIGSLFLRSYERGERVFQAMVSRGFEGEPPALGKTAFAAGDYLFVLGSAGFLLLLRFSA